MPAGVARFVGAALAHGVLALLTTAIFVVAWGVGWSEVGIPWFEYRSDGVEHLVRHTLVAERGWYASTDRLGAPYWFAAADFPASDATILGMIFIFLRFTDDPIVATNLYLWSTFVLASSTAYWAMRRLGASAVPSAVFALGFSFTPFHVYRSYSHLPLAAVFMIPTLFVVLHSMALPWPARDAPTPSPPAPPPWPRSWWVTVVILGVLTGGTGVYFAAMSVGIAGAIGATWAAQLRSWQILWRTAVFTATIVITVAAQLAPSVVVWRSMGLNRAVGHRIPTESELLGLRVLDLLSSVPDSLWPIGWNLTSAVRNWPWMLGVEGATAALGLVGSIGLLGLVTWFLLWSIGTGWSSDRLLGVTALGGFLWFLSGGISPVIAVYLSPQLRAGNRFSIFIAFLALAWLALVATRLHARLVWHQRPLVRLSPWLLLVAVGMLMGAEQVSVPRKLRTTDASMNVVAATIREDRDFVANIERRLERGASIFVLPHVPWPEHPPIGSGDTYEELRLFLAGTQLRWSAGAAVNRFNDWHVRTASMDWPARIGRIALANFAGIVVNEKGFVSRSAEVQKVFVEKLGLSAVKSERGQWTFFDLRSFTERLRATLSDAERAACAEAISYPMELRTVQGFYGAGANEFGYWYVARDVATMVVRWPELPGKARNDAVLVASVTAASPATPAVTYEFLGQQRRLQFQDGYAPLVLNVPAGPRLEWIRFAIDGPEPVFPGNILPFAFRLVNLEVRDGCDPGLTRAWSEIAGP